MNNENKNESRNNVQAVTRVLSMLEIMAKENGVISVSKLAEKAGLKVPTTHRLLNTLKDKGFIEQDPQTLQYRFGIKMIEIGSVAFSSNDLRTLVRPFLEQVCQQMNETVNLAVLDGTEVVYIDQLESSNVVVVKMFAKPGSRGPAYCTGAGKVLLADLRPEELRQRFADVNFVKYTASTIDNIDALLTELSKVKQNGYALDFSERDEGVICVSAPIKNHEYLTEAAVSVSAPAQRMTPERIAQEVVPGLLAITDQASKKLGYVRYLDRKITK